MKKAFTLIEVIVAIGILGIGVLGIAMFFARSSQVARAAGNTTSASNLAQAVIEEELNKSYEELIEGNGAQTKISTNPASPYYIFEKKINISCIDTNLAIIACSGIPVPMKKIDVFIYWQEGSTQKNVQFSTIKTQR